MNKLKSGILIALLFSLSKTPIAEPIRIPPSISGDRESQISSISIQLSRQPFPRFEIGFSKEQLTFITVKTKGSKKKGVPSGELEISGRIRHIPPLILSGPRLRDHNDADTAYLQYTLIFETYEPNTHEAGTIEFYFEKLDSGQVVYTGRKINDELTRRSYQFRYGSASTP